MACEVFRSAGCRLGACIGLLLACIALAACGTSRPGNSNTLWLLVNAGCNQGWAPIPSLHCYPEHGDAVLKDRCGATHFLLIPLAQRGGVESPELLRDDEPDYFGDAWAARDRVVAASGRSDVRLDELGLAINSRWGRSQGQLHIHIDFVRPEVRDAIAQWQREGATAPTLSLFGHRYRIIHAATLWQPSPFQRAAAATDTLQQREMNTIAVIGDRTSGFTVLLGRADPNGADRGHGEEVLVPRQCGI